MNLPQNCVIMLHYCSKFFEASHIRTAEGLFSGLFSLNTILLYVSAYYLGIKFHQTQSKCRHN